MRIQTIINAITLTLLLVALVFAVWCGLVMNSWGVWLFMTLLGGGAALLIGGTLGYALTGTPGLKRFGE